MSDKIQDMTVGKLIRKLQQYNVGPERIPRDPNSPRRRGGIKVKSRMAEMDRYTILTSRQMAREIAAECNMTVPECYAMLGAFQKALKKLPVYQLGYKMHGVFNIEIVKRPGGKFHNINTGEMENYGPYDQMKVKLAQSFRQSFKDNRKDGRSTADKKAIKEKKKEEYRKLYPDFK